MRAARVTIIDGAGYEIGSGFPNLLKARVERYESKYGSAVARVVVQARFLRPSRFSPSRHLASNVVGVLSLNLPIGDLCFSETARAATRRKGTLEAL